MSTTSDTLNDASAASTTNTKSAANITTTLTTTTTTTTTCWWFSKKLFQYAFGILLLSLLLMQSSWNTTSMYLDAISSSTGVVTALPVMTEISSSSSDWTELMSSSFTSNSSSRSSSSSSSNSSSLTTNDNSTATTTATSSSALATDLNRASHSSLPTEDLSSRHGSSENNNKNYDNHYNISASPECAFNPDDNQTYCCATSWSQNLDDWWQHHPEYDVSLENDTTYCFSPMRDPARRQFLLDKLYPLQWQTNCSVTHAIYPVSSGFAANQGQQGRSFMTALMRYNATFVYSKVRHDYVWIYSKYNNHTKFCDSGDMECFFLPISNCQGTLRQLDRARGRYPLEEFPPTGWGRMYLIRPKLFLRRQVYDILQRTPKPKLPCAAMHVRRTDALLENWANKRNYFPLDDYVSAINKRYGTGKRPSNFESIILLTDDQSAIDEAHEFHSTLPWLYINRTRYRGTQGGYNGHKPSNDPAHEIAVILAEMKLVAQCQRIVYTQSGYKDLLIQSMQIQQFDRLDQLEKIEINRRRQPNRKRQTGVQTEQEFFNSINAKRLEQQQQQQQQGDNGNATMMMTTTTISSTMVNNESTIVVTLPGTNHSDILIDVESNRTTNS